MADNYNIHSITISEIIKFHTYQCQLFTFKISHSSGLSIRKTYFQIYDMFRIKTNLCILKHVMYSELK